MKRHIFPTIIILFIFSACTEKIDLELNDSYARLVVEATITDRDDNHRIVLSKTASYFHNDQSPMVDDAEVHISSGDYRWQLLPHAPGQYIASEKFAAQVGETYHLEILYDGRRYRASSLMRPVAAIDSLSVRPHAWLPGHKELLVHFQEPVETEDFYMWKVYLNGENLTNSALRVRMAADDLTNGQYLHYPFYTFRPDDGPLEAGDHIRVEMYSISEAYYLFLVAMRRNQGATGGPFAGPPANIPSNIDNGALGFFLAASVSEAELVIRGD